MVQRFVALLAVGSLGCVQSQGDVVGAPAAPAPLGAAVLPAVTPSPGEPLALVAGGLLASPLVVPMWLDLRDDARKNTQVHQATEALALALDGQHLYLEESNALCSACPERLACRVLDLDKGSLSAPASCMAGPAGGQRQIVPLGGAWFAVHARDEEGSQVSLLAWSADGSRPLLDLDLGASGQVEVTRDSETSVLLRSTCALPAGCARARSTSNEKVFVYRFTEARGLREAR